MKKRGSRAYQKGGAAVEFALLAPWILFVFVGVFDLGFYLNALISTENAARVAGLYYVTSDQKAANVTKACYYALAILRDQPNVGSGLSTCQSSAAAVTPSKPVALSVAAPAGPDAKPAITVSVTYQTMQMIPIPGVLTGLVTVTRIAEFKQ